MNKCLLGSGRAPEKSISRNDQHNVSSAIKFYDSYGEEGKSGEFPVSFISFLLPLTCCDLLDCFYMSSFKRRCLMKVEVYQKPTTSCSRQEPQSEYQLSLTPVLGIVMNSRVSILFHVCFLVLL